jgi:hypothetical protein
MFDPLDFGASGLMEGLQFGHRLGWATGPYLVEGRQQRGSRGPTPLDFRDDRNSVGYSRFHCQTEESTMDENRVEGTAISAAKCRKASAASPGMRRRASKG